MISLPNLLKFYGRKTEVEQYNFNEYLDKAGFADSDKDKEESTETGMGIWEADLLPEFLSKEEEQKLLEQQAAEEIPAEEAVEDTEAAEAEEEAEEEKQVSLAQMYGEEIIREARIEAERILAQAELEAMAQKANAAEEGYEEGYKKGYDEGYARSAADVKETLEAESHAYLEEIREIVDEVTTLKEEVLQKYTHDLKNIAIAIGEKVVQVSLKSSGSVIEKMILAATDKLKTREWAKIYISKVDADLLLRGDKDILKTLSRLSENLKVVVMEDEKPGACIIELPDEIIDASASTQMENIKEILKNTGI